MTEGSPKKKSTKKKTSKKTSKKKTTKKKTAKKASSTPAAASASPPPAAPAPPPPQAQRLGPGAGSEFWSRFKPEEQLLLVGGVLVALLCLLPWYSVTIRTPQMTGFQMHGYRNPAMRSQTFTANGFKTWHGVFIFIFAMANLGLLVGFKSGTFNIARNTVRGITLGLHSLSALFAIIYVAQSDEQSPGLSGLGFGGGREAGKTIWIWLAFGLLAALAVCAFKLWNNETRPQVRPPPPAAE